jgi:Protein of unknown function (DUF3810)
MPFSMIIDPKKTKKTVILGILALILLVFGDFPILVENYYSTGIYPHLARGMHILFGWLPISIGDILYVFWWIWLLVWVVKGFLSLKRNRFNTLRFFSLMGKLLRFILVLFLLFELFWGLNYSRLGIEYQLGITKKEYSKEDITQLTNQLIEKTNQCRKELETQSIPIPDLKSIYTGAFAAYQSVKQSFSFLSLKNKSIKNSLFTPIADYVGFTGYYNPFTGEAQLRYDIPRLMMPFISCHEMAHQLGYASESEANFVGYLSASASTDPYFRYSVYFDLLNYALSEQYFLYAKEQSFADFEKVIAYNKSHIDTLVKLDRKLVRDFFQKRRNDVSPIANSLYDQYLKMNKQLQGINSYDEVLGWLIAYRNKYGRL